MPALLNDLRYAARQFRKSPGFALTADPDPGIGIGANTAVFSVMNAVLLRSLPVPEPNRVSTFASQDGQKYQQHGRRCDLIFLSGI